MKRQFCNMQYLLLALLVFALSGCGANSMNTVADGQNATISAKVALGKSVAKKFDNYSAGTPMKTRLKVTGPTIPTTTAVFTGTSGGEISVYPGSNLIVTAELLDAGGKVAYEGYVANVTVIAGQKTDVGTIQLNYPINKAENAACLNCHETTRSITGQNLIADYKQSGHYTNQSWSANAKNGSSLPGCAGCHGTQHNDTKPSASGRCYECHGANLSLRHTDTRALVAGDTNPARYLDLAGKNCSACHEPHNPLYGAGAKERKEWAVSRHGDIDGLAWKHYDFTIRDTCNSCHTSAGFAKAVNNNFTNKVALSTTTLGKQVLTCDACHSSNDFKNSVRTLSSGYVLPYAASAGASTIYPDGNWLGTSQICIPCHTAYSGGGKAIESRAITSASSPVSHYMTAAATMFMKNGFTAFTSAGTPVKISGASSSTSASTNVPLFTSAGAFRKYTSIPSGYAYTYGNSLTASSDGGAVGSTHRFLGTPYMALQTRGQSLVKGGPCVTCHMGNGTADHTWEINANSYNTVCINCHTSEGTTALNAANFKTLFVEEQAVPFNNALKVGFNNLSTNYHIAYNGATYPYYFKAGTRATLTASDWSLNGTLSVAQVRKLAGAAFNLQMLSREPAAYAHARTYARRLLYDSIDFLDDMGLNMSVVGTAMRLYPADYGASIPANASTATENLKYLKSYNRTSNAWYTPERP